MMKWIPVVLALLLTACSSDSQKTYYQLPTLVAPASSASNSVTTANQRQLWVESVGVADYLNNPGLVYQTTDVQYVIAANNLWASPLEQQLQQALVGNLSSALPGWVVSSRPQSSNQDVLNVTVTGFHGRYDGKVIVSGHWMLNHQGQIITRSFSQEMIQTEDGYDALVRTLAKGWQQQASDIAAQLK